MLPPQARSHNQLLPAVVIASLGGLLFGLDTAVISGAERSLQTFFALDAGRLGFTVAAALLGTIAGSVLVEKPCESLGRKVTLILIALLFVGSSIGSALASHWVMLVSCRFVGGLAVGGASVVCPMYLTEIAPGSIRGRLVAVNQLGIVLGILLAFLSNFVVASLLPVHPDVWRYMLGVVAIPAALFLCLLPAIPESPRWLVKTGRLDAATRSLLALGYQDAGKELADIQRSLGDTPKRERLFQPRFLRPILLAWCLAMFNQLSGITALIYAPRIFGMAGAGERFALLQTVLIGLTNLVFTIAAMVLIDRVGRRQLIIWGSVGYIASLTTVTWLFLQPLVGVSGQILLLICLVVFQASHAIGQGAVLWVFISEIFPTTVREKGQSLATFTHWVMAAAIGWTFPIAAAQSGAAIFGFFAAMMVLQLIFAWKWMPETKGATLEEIEKRLERSPHLSRL